MKGIYNHSEISSREGLSLQRGMNYRPNNKSYSILLMSVRPGAPYNDGFDKQGKRLIYEGEDVSRREKELPKEFDQPLFTSTGKLTNNAMFFKAAEDYKLARRKNPEKVRVYEKIANNIWSDKGYFKLVDIEYRFIDSEKRKVFKFILLPISVKETREETEEFEFSRRIPTEIKKQVWERDDGKCVKCGATQNLHFDHIIPWTKGGSSLDAKNIQILCGKHNIQKTNKIQ